MIAYDYPTVVVGGGAAGLVVASGLAKAGRKVLLIEKRAYGGDCTNYGCIPSKTLIHAAETGPADQALALTRATIQHFASHEGPEALNAIGVDTLFGNATFTNPHTLQVGDRTVTAKNFVICAGSHPFVPPIPGLDTGYLTNETIFDLDAIPGRLGVLGGGAIGCELSQAFADLGSRVTLFEAMPTLMPTEDPEVGPLMQAALEKRGVQIFTGAKVFGVTHGPDGHLISHPHGTTLVDHFLVCVGRRPTVDGLGLDAAGVVHGPQGIKVDKYGRTNKRHIWAVGDCTGGALFTHVAEAQARAVLTSLLLPLFFKKKYPTQPIPRVTYTTPEVAAIGLSEQQAVERYGQRRIVVYRVGLEQVDRAQCTGETDGFIKIVTTKWTSKILGATIVAPRAGEMLMEISTAMYGGMPLRKLAGLLHPYPTYSLGIRTAADRWLTQTILPAIRR